MLFVLNVAKMLLLQSPNKATGLDKIPPKLVKLWSNVVYAHLTYIFDCDISLNVFSNSAKLVSVGSIFKKKDGTNNDLQKISLLSANSIYRYYFSTSYVLIKLIENWRKVLDNSLFTGAVLMDLSKAFHCIPHDVIIAKLHTCCLTFDTVTFIYFCLKERK